MATTTLNAPTGRQYLLLALLVLFCLVSLHYAWTKAAEGRSAILRWDDQLRDLDEGVNIAERHAYPNPPIMAILLYPLAHLPSPMATALTWFYIKVVLTLLAVTWTFRLVETPERPFPLAAQLLTLVLVLRPILGDLQHGNVNLFILFLVIGSLYAYRSGYDVTAGLVLALAIGCKITPALFLPYFVWKRAWKVLAGSVVGLALFLYPGIVPACFLGWEDNQQHLRGWYQVMVHPYIVEGRVTSEQVNQSLPGLMFRLTTYSPSTSTWVDATTYTPLTYHNFMDLPSETVKWLLKGAMLLFGLGIVIACRTPTQPRVGWRLAAEFSLITLGMLLFSERTWKHHAVTLLLPFAVLAYLLVEHWSNVRLRWITGVTLGLAMVLMALTSNGLVSKSIAKLFQIYGAYTLLFLLLSGILGVILLRYHKNRFHPPLDSGTASQSPV